MIQKSWNSYTILELIAEFLIEMYEMGTEDERRY
jgi:hypothetical protein